MLSNVGDGAMQKKAIKQEVVTYQTVCYVIGTAHRIFPIFLIDRPVTPVCRVHYLVGLNPLICLRVPLCSDSTNDID